MRFRRRGERKSRADSHLERTACNPRKQVTAPRVEFRPRLRVVRQCRPREEERAALRQQQRRERRHRATGVAIRHQHPARTQTRKRALKRFLAHAVVNDIDAAPPANARAAS